MKCLSSLVIWNWKKETYICSPCYYLNETAFHLLIIFYCKDLNFFTFTNFANCSTSNLIMLCILGNGGPPHALLDSNNESRRASVFFWIATHLRNQVHFYVDEVADAWETHICRCMRKTYMQMPYNRYRCTSLQLQQCKCIFGCMCIYEPPKDMQMQKQHSDAHICSFSGLLFIWSGKRPGPLLVWSEFAYNLYELASMARKWTKYRDLS